MEGNDNIYVTKPYMVPLEEYVQEIAPIWDSHILTNMGEKHNLLEAKLREFLRVENFSLFSNGHMALELAIQAMQLKGEVITTPFTFASTTHAIIRNGLTPVFCDINSENYTIDVNKIENLITDRTAAIVPVHVYGNICDVEVIQKIAEKYNLKVIYDAAHAFGVKVNGIGVGSYGNASMFSFHATKVFHTIEGGGVAYNDAELGLELYRLRNFGIRNETVIDGIGTNAKLNEFQAAMGLCNLRHFQSNIEARRIIDEKYRELLGNVKGIYITKPQENVERNFAYFPIFIDKDQMGCTRDDIYDALKRNNIYARKYFYPLTSAFACFKDRIFVGETPVACRISEGILTLPIYSGLSLEQVAKICTIISERGR